MSLLSFALVLSLGAYRLARIITMEDGPFDLAVKFREWVYTRFDENHWINRGLSCPYCVSFWLALLLALLAWQSPQMTILLWLGAAGGSALLFSWEFHE